jgi:hypothetical protein
MLLFSNLGLLEFVTLLGPVNVIQGMKTPTDLLFGNSLRRDLWPGGGNAMASPNQPEFESLSGRNNFTTEFRLGCHTLYLNILVWFINNILDRGSTYLL